MTSGNIIYVYYYLWDKVQASVTDDGLSFCFRSGTSIARGNGLYRAVENISCLRDSQHIKLKALFTGNSLVEHFVNLKTSDRQIVQSICELSNDKLRYMCVMLR